MLANPSGLQTRAPSEIAPRPSPFPVKRLHTSYHNLGSWKLVREPDHSALHIVYNAKPVILPAVLVFVLCGVFAAHVAQLPIASGKAFAVGILAITGILVPAGMGFYAFTETGKKPLLTYRPTDDLLIVRDPALEIQGAYQRVSFSSEHFLDGGAHYFEFNIVVDGERRKFLSSNANRFKRLARDLNEMGFYVSEQTLKA